MTQIAPGYSIQQITADKDQKIVSIDWTYVNNDGHLGGHHTMHAPYGNVALGKVTSDLALTWLRDQLGNTQQEFDQYLSDQKAKAAFEDSLEDYNVHAIVGPSKVEPQAPAPEPEPAPEVSTMPANRTRKKKAD